MLLQETQSDEKECETPSVAVPIVKENNVVDMDPILQKILDASAAVLARNGGNEASQTYVMMLAGYTEIYASEFQTNLSRLHEKGLITYSNESILLTELGHLHAQNTMSVTSSVESRQPSNTVVADGQSTSSTIPQHRKRQASKNVDQPKKRLATASDMNASSWMH